MGLGVGIPAALALIALLYFHFRHVKKMKKEEENGPDIDIDNDEFDPAEMANIRQKASAYTLNSNGEKVPAKKGAEPTIMEMTTRTMDDPFHPMPYKIPELSSSQRSLNNFDPHDLGAYPPSGPIYDSSRYASPHTSRPASPASAVSNPYSKPIVKEQVSPATLAHGAGTKGETASPPMMENRHSSSSSSDSASFTYSESSDISDEILPREDNEAHARLEATLDQEIEELEAETKAHHARGLSQFSFGERDEPQYTAPVQAQPVSAHNDGDLGTQRVREVPAPKIQQLQPALPTVARQPAELPASRHHYGQFFQSDNAAPTAPSSKPLPQSPMHSSYQETFSERSTAPSSPRQAPLKQQLPIKPPQPLSKLSALPPSHKLEDSLSTISYAPQQRRANGTGSNSGTQSPSGYSSHSSPRPPLTTPHEERVLPSPSQLGSESNLFSATDFALPKKYTAATSTNSRSRSNSLAAESARAANHGHHYNQLAGAVTGEAHRPPSMLVPDAKSQLEQLRPQMNMR